jgi:hypothetical protein
MTSTRKRRLLCLATTPNAWHKRWYSQYCELIAEGLVGWAMGTAYLTDKGRDELRGLWLVRLAELDRGLL